MKNLSRMLLLTTLWLTSIIVMATEYTQEQQAMKVQADQAYQSGDFVTALKIYAPLYYAYQADDELEYKMASCYYYMQKYSYATRHANNLVSRNPHSIDALMILVHISLSENRLTEARAYLTAILSIDNRHAEAYRLLSTVLGQQGDAAGQEAAYSHYLEYK